jgi:bifunctional non-homologous end joining protein LigD
MGRPGQEAARVDRGDLIISHPEKELFPEDGITKGDLCAYYESVAPFMLPHLRDRPVTLERFPGGIRQKGFIQKDVSKGFPAWLERVEIPKRAGQDDGSVHYPLARDLRSLLWLANQNCITPHVWCSRVPRLDRPDVCVIDLDPSGDDAGAVRRAALLVRELLDELGVPPFVKTSGSKGYHVVVPLDGDAGFDVSWRFARGAGAVLVKRHPELFTQEFIKADRAGRIFVDTGRNAPGATFAAAYAVRPRPGAPVSAPCTWAEVERGDADPRSFTLRAMSARVNELGDVWRELRGAETSLTAPIHALERLLTDEDWAEAHAAATRRPTSRKALRKG